MRRLVVHISFKQLHEVHMLQPTTSWHLNPATSITLAVLLM